jgi:pyruvate kinase
MNLILTENGRQLRRTKIIATLGPATDDREVLEGIIRAGAALQVLWRLGAVAAGDQVILTMGDRMGNQGGTNTLRLIRVDPDGGYDHQTELDLYQSAS